VRRGWVKCPEDCAWSTAYAERQEDMDWDKMGFAR
jgi:hypothetical protein